MMNINYIEVKSQEAWNPKRVYGEEEYVEVYFVIETKDFQDLCFFGERHEQVQKTFDEDCQAIFESINWTFVPSTRKAAANEAIQGKQSLYLHPLHFSGVVLKNEVQAIAEALTQANTFELCRVEIYETFCSMPDDVYAEYLETQRPILRQKIYQAFQQDRKEWFEEVDGMCHQLSKKIRIHRVEKRFHVVVGESLEEQQLFKLVDEMLTEGYLVKDPNKSRLYVRSATPDELQEQNLAPII